MFDLLPVKCDLSVDSSYELSGKVSSYVNTCSSAHVELAEHAYIPCRVYETLGERFLSVHFPGVFNNTVTFQLVGYAFSGFTLKTSVEYTERNTSHGDVISTQTAQFQYSGTNQPSQGNGTLVHFKISPTRPTNSCAIRITYELGETAMTSYTHSSASYRPFTIEEHNAMREQWSYDDDGDDYQAKHLKERFVNDAIPKPGANVPFRATTFSELTVPGTTALPLPAQVAMDDINVSVKLTSQYRKSLCNGFICRLYVIAWSSDQGTSSFRKIPFQLYTSNTGRFVFAFGNDTTNKLSNATEAGLGEAGKAKTITIMKSTNGIFEDISLTSRNSNTDSTPQFRYTRGNIRDVGNDLLSPRSTILIPLEANGQENIDVDEYRIQLFDSLNASAKFANAKKTTTNEQNMSVRGIPSLFFENGLIPIWLQCSDTSISEDDVNSMRVYREKHSLFLSDNGNDLLIDMNDPQSSPGGFDEFSRLRLSVIESSRVASHLMPLETDAIQRIKTILDQLYPQEPEHIGYDRYCFAFKSGQRDENTSETDNLYNRIAPDPFTEALLEGLVPETTFNPIANMYTEDATDILFDCCTNDLFSNPQTTSRESDVCIQLMESESVNGNTTENTSNICTSKMPVLCSAGERWNHDNRCLKWATQATDNVRTSAPYVGAWCRRDNVTLRTIFEDPSLQYLEAARLAINPSYNYLPLGEDTMRLPTYCRFRNYCIETGLDDNDPACFVDSTPRWTTPCGPEDEKMSSFYGCDVCNCWDEFGTSLFVSSYPIAKELLFRSDAPKWRPECVYPPCLTGSTHANDVSHFAGYESSRPPGSGGGGLVDIEGVQAAMSFQLKSGASYGGFVEPCPHNCLTRSLVDVNNVIRESFALYDICCNPNNPLGLISNDPEFENRHLEICKNEIVDGVTPGKPIEPTLPEDPDDPDGPTIPEEDDRIYKEFEIGVLSTLSILGTIAISVLIVFVVLDMYNRNKVRNKNITR